MACSPLRPCTSSRPRTHMHTHKNPLGCTAAGVGLSPLQPNHSPKVTAERSATCGISSISNKAAVVRSLATSFSANEAEQRATAQGTTAAGGGGGAVRASPEDAIPGCLLSVPHRALVAASMAAVRDEVAHLLERCGLTVVCAASLEEVVWRFSSSLPPAAGAPPLGTKGEGGGGIVGYEPGDQQFSLVLLELEVGRVSSSCGASHCPQLAANHRCKGAVACLPACKREPVLVVLLSPCPSVLSPSFASSFLHPPLLCLRLRSATASVASGRYASWRLTAPGSSRGSSRGGSSSGDGPLACHPACVGAAAA